MSLLQIIVSLASFLFLFSGFAAAEIYGTGCTASALDWTFNSLPQNGCVVAAFLVSTCNGGSFTIHALPPGEHYLGPTASQSTDLCLCNTVAYSLISACGACQAADWIPYSTFVANCTKVMTPGSFPNTVPSGTRVPHWALLNVTGTWDKAKAEAAGDLPELGPGSRIPPA